MWNTPVVPGTGLILSARGCQSRTDPSHPSGVAPGKRPRLTPKPGNRPARRWYGCAAGCTGWGCAGTIHAPGVPQYLPLWHGCPGCDRCTTRDLAQFPVFVLSVINTIPAVVSLENRIGETVRKGPRSCSGPPPRHKLLTTPGMRRQLK